MSELRLLSFLWWELFFVFMDFGGNGIKLVMSCCFNLPLVLFCIKVTDGFMAASRLVFLVVAVVAQKICAVMAQVTAQVYIRAVNTLHNKKGR
jgi:hypothetical protein